MRQMKGHYFFKWLFLTVLSVSVPHFREARVACYHTEQVSYNQGITGQQSLLAIGNYKPSIAQAPVFANFKNAQHILLTILSISLSGVVNRLSDFSPEREASRIHIQNQHFRSRTLSSGDHFIFCS